MSAKPGSRADRGFTLIEVVVALAVVATTLAAIGAVIATTTKSARGIEERLALSGIAETLLNGMAARGALRPGRSVGEIRDRRWWIDVSPLPSEATDADASPDWQPFAVNIRVEAPAGQSIELTTVRMLPRAGG